MGLGGAAPLQGFGGLFDSWHYLIFSGARLASGFAPFFFFGKAL
jgi:hypothetical protein